MKLYYSNFLDEMILTPSSEVDECPVENLQQKHLYKKWKTTNSISENVVCEVPSGYQEFGLSSKAVGTESGLSRISPEVVFNAATTSDIAIAWLNSTHFVIAYKDEGNSDHGTAIVGALAADGTISFGAENVFNAATTSYISVVGLDATHFVITYRDEGNSNQGTAIVGVTDGAVTISSYGAENVFNAAITAYTAVTELDTTHFAIAYRDDGNANQGTGIIGVTDGAVTISSYGVENLFNTAATSRISISALDSTHFVVAYRDDGNSDQGTAIVGVTDGAVTISSYGAENIFNAAVTSEISAASLDSTRFVVAYKDEGNSDQGTAIVGLIGGLGGLTILSYGAENVFNAFATNYISVAKTETNKFIVAYQDDGGADYGAFRIGSTLGTTISGYDTEYEFNTAVTSDVAVIALDSIHYIVAYKDEGNSNHGTARALAPKFYINIDVDGAGIGEDSIQLTAGNDFVALMAALETAVAGTGWSVTGEDLRCTTDTFGASGSISITAGTSGLDLAAHLTGFTVYDTAIAGVGSGAVTAAFLTGYNISSAAVVKIQGNATNAWGGPTVNITMTRGANGIYYALAGFSTLKWWRFLVTDPTNVSNYIEIGRAWLGDTINVTTGPAKATSENRLDESMIFFSRSGESYGDKRYRHRAYDITFPKWDNTQKALIETFLDTVMAVDPFFVAFDENNIDKMPLMYSVVGPEAVYNNLISLTKWGGTLNFREVR